jgi:hypothetical protein
MPQNHDAWLEQIKAPCPTCGAPAGSPCVREERGQTVEIRGTHNARKALGR